jgi:hypothetical protein
MTISKTQGTATMTLKELVELLMKEYSIAEVSAIRLALPMKVERI